MRGAIIRAGAIASAVVSMALVAGPTEASRTIIVKNNCSQTIWPGIFEQGINGNPPPNPQPMNGGWALSTGQSTTLTLPDGFAGRIWARKDCTFNASGQGSCETGDCGGLLQCNGATGIAGTSLAEFTLYQPANISAFPQDWYDVSYVDGYDFPVSITPSNSTYEAPNVSFDMLPTCPVGQQVKNAQGVVVQCLSACVRYGNDPTVPTNVQEIYCCLPPYNSAAQCNPSNYPNTPGNLDAPFKAAAPNSYSWSDDDPTSVWHYNGDSTVTYTVTFCPTSPYGTVVQTTGSGTYNGPVSTSGAWNSCTSTTIPSAPTGLAAVAGSGQVSLTWTASSGATSYNVYRGVTAGGESTTPIATGISTASFTNTGLTNGTAYYYKIAAVNGSGTSGLSGEVSATPKIVVPAIPTGLSATAGSGQVSLSWSASSGATSYDVYSGTSAGGESTTAIATGITGTSYTNTGLTNGTTYFYKVAAVDSAGTSALSSEASATPQASTSISINCGGAAASPYVADVDFSGGGTQVVTNTIDTSLLAGSIPPQAVLQSNRYNAPTYTIPGFPAASSHTVTLYFAEEYWAAAGKRVMNVSINGTQVLTNFDIYATAGAEFKAVQKSFTATANSSGQIVISMTNVTDNAQINGISIN